jgi:hypothetical protein
MTLLALMMVSASLAAWIVAGASPPDAKPYVRLASANFAAYGIAVAVSGQLAGTVESIALAVGPALLALAMHSAWRGRPSAALGSLALVLAAVCGLAAATTNARVLALAPLIAAVAAMVLIALTGPVAARAHGAQAVAAALSFLAGGCLPALGGTFAQPGLMLFSSAGLLGVALALARDSDAPVEDVRTRDLRGRAIR